MIKAIIFDWFGVCVEKWIYLWERELGPKVDSNLLRKHFFENLSYYADNSISGHEYLNRVFRGINLEPTGYQYLLKKLGKLNHGLLDTILKLRKAGYKTAILSDNFNEIVPVIEQEIGGFGRYFDVICLSNRLNMGKSNKQIFLKTKDLLGEFGIKDENCIFIDDREKPLSIGEQVGWKTILYESNSQLRNRLAEYGVNVP